MIDKISAAVEGLSGPHREKGKVDKSARVFQLVTHLIPTFLDCTIADDLRPHFEIKGSTGMGTPAVSPRYSFPTKGNVRDGIFVCTQYETLRNGSLGDYLVSIIVGRDGLKHKTDNVRRAMSEIVGAARDILAVESNFKPRRQGNYAAEIIDQTSFSAAHPPTAQEFRDGINGMLRRVVENKADLDDTWDRIAKAARDYLPDPQVAEIQRRGRRGEEFVMERERSQLTHLGFPDLAARVRKMPAKGPNHDICTYRIVNGQQRKHYIEVKTTERPRFTSRISRLQTEFALLHPDETSIVIITHEMRDEPIVDQDVAELVTLEERKRYFRREILESRAAICG